MLGLLRHPRECDKRNVSAGVRLNLAKAANLDTLSRTPETGPMKASSILVTFAMVAACDSSSSKSYPSDNYQAYCKAQCDRNQSCNLTTVTAETCAADCTSGGPKSGIFKPGVYSTLTTCTANLQCGVSDDQCMTQALTAQDANWEQNGDLQACIARHTACSTDVSAFLDDMCVSLVLCTSTTVAMVKDCLAQDCGAISACLQSALGS